MIPPYPLSWPDGIPRTPAISRKKSAFKTTLAGAIANVSTSLRLFGSDSGRAVTNVVATTNIGGVQLEAVHGSARSIDPGVAVWFDWDGATRCIAVDRYEKPEHNLQAIHHILEARRTEVRHGGIVIARTAFRGFVALPSPEKKRRWFEVLGVPEGATQDHIESAYRQKARELHPDLRGGSHEAMSELNAARTEGLRSRT